MIHFYISDERAGQEAFDQIRSAYPPDGPQEISLEMANLFQETYDQWNFQEACTAARDFAEENFELILDLLGLVRIGYYCQEFNPEIVCPWD